MENMEVKVEIGDLYQFLIAECRYGYKRNNHLMPWGAYEHVKQYLPIMYEVDADYALHTACQLCDECISQQLTNNFYDGLDDVHGSRKEAIEFIDWLLDWINDNSENTIYEHVYRGFKPYNYYLYEENLKRESEFKYRLYEVNTFDIDSEFIFKDNIVREITTEPVSWDEVNKLLFEGELKSNTATFNKKSIYPRGKVIGEVDRIIEPSEFQGKIYVIIKGNQ